jgi:Holliday junction DNA helicase RuvA
MIGRLSGTIASLETDHAIIDVNGVGYEVHGHARLLQRLGLGDAATLSIETVVREDMIRLYGFESEAERQAFRLVQSVQGVGARHALSILQVLPPDDLYDAIAAEDVTSLARAHGVGKKLAQRIATELSSKVGAIAGSGAKLAAIATKLRGDEKSSRSDAVSALSNLGYSQVQASSAIARVVSREGEDVATDKLIRLGLRELSS